MRYTYEFSALLAKPGIELFRRADDGTQERERVSRASLRNWVRIGDDAFHVIPEAMLPGNQVYFCTRCATWKWEQRWTKKPPAQEPAPRAVEPAGPLNDPVLEQLDDNEARNIACFLRQASVQQNIETFDAIDGGGGFVSTG